MKKLAIACVAVWLTAISEAGQSPAGQFRTLDDRFAAPHFSTLDQWKERAAYLREHVLASAGLLPMPEKTPLNPSIFGEIEHGDYRVAKVYFESLPGFYVTGNLYRPKGDGPFPAVLSPHGHWAYGRLENTALNSGPGRAIGLARQGFVVFTYDMIGYNDSHQLTHTFGARRESLWGLSLSGLQLWNSIRALDFLETLPYVRRDALGATGESGGGTQTFLLAAADPRVAVAVPVNMISLHMQGGCLCENPPGLRVETTNVEIAATIAPRPLLMISATGDWTGETLEKEYPAVRTIYELYGAADRVHAVRFEAEHNYNRDSREAMYAWMARWFQQAPSADRRAERPFTPDPVTDLLVFFQRPLPPEAVTPAQFTDRWIDAARRQLAASEPSAFAPALRHALGFAADRTTAATGRSRPGRTVLAATSDRDLLQALAAAGLQVQPIAFTPFDTTAAANVRHFETYNRTAASQRVADIVGAVRAAPGAPIVADGDAALAALLAAAIADVPLSILDVDRFDTSSDAPFLDHLYIPGLRRAGDLQTAAAIAYGKIVVHNAGDRFAVKGPAVHAAKLSPREVVGVLAQGSRR